MSEPTIPITNITPEKVSDEIDLILVVTAPERDGQAFASVFVPTGHGHHEEQARSMLGAYEHQRFATLVRVRVPRALLRERWAEAKR